MKLEKIPFGAADILVPATDFEKWACVACDQFTSEPQYWLEVAKTVGGAPSAFNLIIPEVWLGVNDAERAERINAEMHRYLNENIFTEYPDSMVYVERTLPDGSVRRGLVGAVDLEAYDYEAYGYIFGAYPVRMGIFYDTNVECDGLIYRGAESTSKIMHEWLDDGALSIYLDSPLPGDSGKLSLAAG